MSLVPIASDERHAQRQAPRRGRSAAEKGEALARASMALSWNSGRIKNQVSAKGRFRICEAKPSLIMNYRR